MSFVEAEVDYAENDWVKESLADEDDNSLYHYKNKKIIVCVKNKWLETKKDDDYECTTRIIGDKWGVSQENFVHSNKKFFYASRVCIQDACNMQTKLTILKDSFSGKYSPDYKKQL